MSLTTYDGLKQAISDHLDRDDLDAYVDDFIDIAEARHKREVRFREMLVRCPLTIVNRYTDLPSGFLEGKVLRLLTNPPWKLEYVNVDVMTSNRREVSARPFCFTVNDQIEVDSIPDQPYNAEMVFFKTLTPLSDNNSTNKLLERAPDVYLYSSLAASAPFLMNDERIDLWNSLYANARDSLNELDAKPVGPVITKLSGRVP